MNEVDQNDVHEPEPDPRRGWVLVRANWVVTAVLAVSLGLGLTAPRSLGVVAAFISIAMLLAGIVAFIYSFFVALDRSRTEEISTAGLYLLAEGAPAATRWNMIGAIVAQSAVAVTAALIEPTSALIFGVLAPMLGLGIAGIWSAKHGVFRPRFR
ncbi:MAG: hypothetical protein GXP35_00275 [Actinobacteria bacterium]|nr:hypothetical protein [Actinomycetota bacterium]